MQIIPLKTNLFKPKDSLIGAIETTLEKTQQKPKNGDLIAIASKVVALSQNRIVSALESEEIDNIIEKEADQFWGKRRTRNGARFTIKDRILIPRAGIDTSNIEEGKVILWPKNSWEVARELRKYFLKKYKLNDFGILITDSTCRPLRWGTSNIALGWAGFEGVSDERGKPDLFGKPLKITIRAVADSLSAAAGVVTGEAGESIPFVLIREAPVKFTQRTRKPAVFNPKNCLFAPIYSSTFRKIEL